MTQLIQDLYAEICKACIKEIKDNLNRDNIFMDWKTAYSKYIFSSN